MDFTYFILDKNPKQFKKLSVNGYEIELRIEWNIRGNAWYVLGYIKDDIVLRNTKFEARKVYSFDNDTPYDLPYSLMIYPESSDNDWNTETYFVYYEDVLANADQGMSESGILIDRRYGTSSSTHSKKALRSDDNKYLFDVIVPYVEELWELQSASLLDGRGVYSFKRGSESVDLNVDLTEAITASLSDVDMQQWQAVKDAANELTGVTDWVFDTTNNQVTFIEPFIETNVVDSHDQYGYTHSAFNGVLYKTVKGACMVYAPSAVNFYITGQHCQAWSEGDTSLVAAVAFSEEINPIYDENIGQITKTLPYSSIADEIISNASSSEHGISLLAETYLKTVVDSVYETNPSKQFITLDYLKSLL